MTADTLTYRLRRLDRAANRRRVEWSALGWLLLGVFICTAEGCNVVGFAGQAIAGQTHEAVYLPPRRPTVLVAEKFSNPADAVLDDEPLARYVTEELDQHQVAPMIAPDKVYTLRSGRPDAWRGMTIAAVGREVGAEQIIYVNILGLGIETASGSEMMRGRATVLVRVIDTASGATMWPTGTVEGYPVSAETRMVRRGENNIYEGQLRSTLHRELASKIATLFYTYKKE